MTKPGDLGPKAQGRQEHAWLQALGVDFLALSVSEANPVYRSIIEANHGKAIKTTFDDVNKQVSHYMACPQKASPDIGVTGSPCNPFSSQRVKRFAAGNVALHVDYETTMTSVVSFYATLEPKLGVTEQVAGFKQPMSSEDPTTPLQQFLGLFAPVGREGNVHISCHGNTDFFMIVMLLFSSSGWAQTV